MFLKLRSKLFRRNITSRAVFRSSASATRTVSSALSSGSVNARNRRVQKSALPPQTRPKNWQLLYNLCVAVLHNLRVTLEMIKWEHSIFALPFALCGAMLAANGLPGAHQLVWIIVAMVAARSAAMAFNRLADASIDAANPRTRSRALPAGTLTPGSLRHSLSFPARCLCWPLGS